MVDTQVGARLVLAGRAAFVGDADAAETAIKGINDELARTAELAAAAGDALGGIGVKGEAAAAGTGASTAAAGDMEKATLAASAASVEQQRNLEKGTVALSAGTTAAKKYEGALAGLASNSAIKKLSLYGGLGIAGGLYEGIKMYTGFQKSMTQLVTLAGLPQARLGGLMTSALGISRETGMQASAVADQFYRITSANSGLHTTNKELTQMATVVAKMSVVLGTTSGSQADQASRIFGAILNASAKNNQGAALQGAGSYQHIAALAAATVGTGDMRGADLVGALGRGVLISGQAVNAKLPDLLAWIALSTKYAANASTSGTLISHSLQMIANPSPQGQKVEEMFGMSTGELQHILSTKGINAAMTTFYKSVTGGLNVSPYYPTFQGQSPGRQSAIAQLNAWGLQSNQPLYNALINGRPLSAGQKTELFSLMAGRTFGQAKQETQALLLALNQQKMSSTEAQIIKDATNSRFDKLYGIARNAPAQRAQIALNSMKVDLMELGKWATGPGVKILQGISAIANWFTRHTDLAKEIVGALVLAIGGATLIRTINMISRFLGPVVGAVKSTSFFGSQSAADIQYKAAQMQLTAAERNDIGGGNAAKTAGGLSGFFTKAAGAALIGVVAGTTIKYLANAAGVHGSAANQLGVIGGLTIGGAALAGPWGAVGGLIAGGFLEAVLHITKKGPVDPRLALIHRRDYPSQRAYDEARAHPGASAAHYRWLLQHPSALINRTPVSNGWTTPGGISYSPTWERMQKLDVQRQTDLTQAKKIAFESQQEKLTAQNSNEKSVQSRWLALAKQHQEAADALKKSARDISDQIRKLGSTPITATISGQAVTAASQKGNASLFARGVGGGPKPALPFSTTS